MRTRAAKRVFVPGRESGRKELTVRHQATYAVCVLLALTCVGLAADEKPALLVKNPSMEETDGKSHLPAGYLPVYQGIVQADSSVAFEGKRSVKLTLRGQFESFGFYQHVASTAPEGAPCHFRVHVRTHDLQGDVFFQIYRYPNPEQEFKSVQKVSGTQDWTTLDAVAPAKNGGDAFMVRMMVTGSAGQVWFDNLEAWVEEKK
jgi:hypothetical protein